MHTWPHSIQVSILDLSDGERRRRNRILEVSSLFLSVFQHTAHDCASQSAYRHVWEESHKETFSKFLFIPHKNHKIVNLKIQQVFHVFHNYLLNLHHVKMSPDKWEPMWETPGSPQLSYNKYLWLVIGTLATVDDSKIFAFQELYIYSGMQTNKQAIASNSSSQADLILEEQNKVLFPLGPHCTYLVKLQRFCTDPSCNTYSLCHYADLLPIWLTCSISLKKIFFLSFTFLSICHRTEHLIDNDKCLLNGCLGRAQNG